VKHARGNDQPVDLLEWNGRRGVRDAFLGEKVEASVSAGEAMHGFTARFERKRKGAADPT
jgi:hypothetical protein